MKPGQETDQVYFNKKHLVPTYACEMISNREKTQSTISAKMTIKTKHNTKAAIYLKKKTQLQKFDQRWQ